jgi:hypothetical protein
MTLHELKAYRLALREKLRELDRIQASCQSCEHFANGKTCAKFGAEPPEEFKRTPEACAEWQYDRIPF